MGAGIVDAMKERSRTSCAGLAAAVLASFLFGVTPACATSLDETSTHAAAVVFETYLAGLLADGEVSEQGEDAFVATVGASCPDVLAAVNLLPLTSTSRAAVVAFDEEVEADLVLARSVSAKRAVFAAFATAVEKLHWSTRAIAVTVRRSVEGERAYFLLAPSDVCADARALAAVDATTTPQGTLAFLAAYGHVEAVEGLGGLTSTLNRFSTRADDRLIKAANRNQSRIDEERNSLVKAEYAKLLSELGLTP